MRPRTALILFAMLAIGAVLLGAFALANAAEVESVRDSQYEWTCEDTAGNVISGHTRQDKAFQSCYNAALASGDVFIVRGGTFRVTATGTTTPPPEPPPEPDPPPEPPPPDPAPEPQVTFGPISSPLQYAGIGALKQDRFRWVIRATFNSVGTVQGIASRDQSGTADKGHLTIWLGAGGKINVRNQAGDDPAVAVTPQEIMASNTVIEPGREYEIVVSLSDGEFVALWIDGNFEASAGRAWGLANNDLPLTLGARCTSCTADGSVGPGDPIDGTVYMEIWDAAIPPPDPVAIELRWTNPTQYVDGTPIAPADLTAIRLYQDGQQVAGVDPDVAVYEVTGLLPGNTYCFEATAVAELESERSNQVCRSP